MNKFSLALAVCAAALMTGCSTAVVPAGPAQAAALAQNAPLPAGAARVYVLPTHSSSLYGRLNGRATVALFQLGFSHGVTVGSTNAHTYVVFDIGAGSYDLRAEADPISKVTKTMTFVAGQTYYLRPTFFRSGDNLKWGQPLKNMALEPVPAATARAEIAKMRMSAIPAEGKIFLARTLAPHPQGYGYNGTMPYSYMPSPPVAPTAGPAPAAQPTPAAAAPVPAPAPQPAPQAVAPRPAAQTPAAVKTESTVLEEKLRALKSMEKQGLITRQEFDAKRKSLLGAY